VIALAATQFDVDGAVLLPTAETRSRIQDRTRRVYRQATLDGGATLIDRGYTDADRTLYVTERAVSQAVADAVIYLFETYTRILVATRHGVYHAAPSQYTYAGDELTLTALVSSKVSA